MVISAETGAGTRSRHYAAMKWLADHPEALDDFVGEWTAVADERIVAHGESMGEVVREARRLGFDEPLLVPVMPYPFIGG